MRFDKLIRFQRLVMDLVEARDAIVPFEQGRRLADPFDGVGVKLPDRIEHRMIVGIENVFLELRMARDVDLPDTMMRNVVQVFVGIEVMILRAET